MIDLCSALASAGHDVTLVTEDPHDAPEPWKACEPGFPRVTCLQTRSELSSLLALPSMRVRTALEGAEVVHLHNLWTPSAFHIAKEASRLGISCVVSPRGTLDDWAMSQRSGRKRAYFCLFAGPILKRAAAVHFTAAVEMDQARIWLPNARGTVISNLIPIKDFENLPGPQLAEQTYDMSHDDGQITVLFLGRLHYKKNPDLLLRAAADLRQSQLAVRVMLAGPGEPAYVRSLRELAGKLGIGDAVQFLGFVCGPAKISLYQAADVFVLPSSQENFGRTLFESLACGTPVVTTYGVDVWRELEDGGGAVMANLTSGSIAEAIRELAVDRERRKEMGRIGRRWVFDYLDSDRLRIAYEDLYLNAVRPTPEERD